MDQKKLLPERYVPRVLEYCLRNKFRQTIDDHRFFSTAFIRPSTRPVHIPECIQNGQLKTIIYGSKSGIVTESLDELFTKSGTTAFLVIHDGKIIEERYYNGGSKNAPSRLMSATKSFLSTLIGIAIRRGEIQSTQQTVTDFIPELKNRGFEKITLQHLLNMESGIPFDQGRMPWSLQMKQYFSSDARRDLMRLKLTDPIGTTFHYNDWYPNLLELILERVTGRKGSEYFESMLWQPIGSQYTAYLVEDSERNHFAKMDSGLVATAIDFAKLGMLYLNKGLINGTQILPENWVSALSTPPKENLAGDYYSRYISSPWGRWFQTGNAYYRNMWWGYRDGEDISDFFAMGVLGQILFVSPRNRAVLVRLGKDWGIQAWWPTVLKNLADGLRRD